MIIETSRAFGRGILEGILRFVRENDHWSVDFEDRGLLEAPPEFLADWKGDGIISRTPSIHFARRLTKTGCPIVELLGDGRIVVPEIRNCERTSARLAVDHFLQRGLRNFAFYSFAQAWWAELRKHSFVEQISARNLEGHVYSDAFPQKRSTHKPSAYPVWETQFERPLIQWLRSLPKPVGVWTANDYQALRVLSVCRKANIGVPEEIAVLGTTNDILVCNLSNPPLSSIDLNSAEIGYRAAALLESKMNGQTTPLAEPILVQPSGVVTRQSTEMLAVTDPDVAAAIRFIRENATQGVLVSEVVRAVGISHSTLERRFRQWFGRTPEQEISRIRMERAKFLLRETTLSLTEIAKKTGFSTLSYFVQAFKHDIGQTPQQFRKG